jgi:hypothetical protein
MTRDDVFKLLSEGEVASVDTANAKTQLGNGDEYLDLEQLRQGVQRAKLGVTRMGHLLPRKGIYEDAWRRVLRQLKATPASGNAYGAFAAGPSVSAHGRAGVRSSRVT